MSIPAFAWALDRGAALGLKPADRLVLIYIADQANGERVGWPGQPKMAKYTGLAPNTIIVSLRRLEALQLIRAEVRTGYATRYHLLMEDTPANGGGDTPANGGGDTPQIVGEATPANGGGDTPQIVGGHPRKCGAEPPHDLRSPPPNRAPDPLSTQVRDPRKTRVPARSGAGFKNSGSQGGTPPPAPTRPRAAQRGTTGGSSVERQPGAAVYAPVEEAREVFADYLAGLRQDRDAARPAAPDPRANPAAVKRAAAATIYQLKKYAPAPGVAPVRSRNEMADEVLHGEVLAPIRRGPVEAERTPEEQYAKLLGISLAEATAVLSARTQAAAE